MKDIDEKQRIDYIKDKIRLKLNTITSEPKDVNYVNSVREMTLQALNEAGEEDYLYEFSFSTLTDLDKNLWTINIRIWVDGDSNEKEFISITYLHRGIAIYRTINEQPKELLIERVKSLEELSHNRIKKINEMKSVFKEADDYLNINEETSIGHNSILHKKFREYK